MMNRLLCLTFTTLLLLGCKSQSESLDSEEKNSPSNRAEQSQEAFPDASTSSSNKNDEDSVNDGLTSTSSTCEDIKKYELITTCTDTISASVTIDNLQVCIYKKNNRDSTYRIKHSMLIDGIEEKFSHKFKSEYREFETVEYKSLLGLRKKKHASYSLIGGTYSFEEAKGLQTVLSATCTDIQ